MKSWLWNDPVKLAAGSTAVILLVSLVVLGGLPYLDLGCHPVKLDGPNADFQFNDTPTDNSVEIRLEVGDQLRPSHTYVEVGGVNRSWAELDDDRNASRVERGDTVTVDGVRDDQHIRVVWLPKDRYEAPDACDEYSPTVLDSRPLDSESTTS